MCNAGLTVFVYLQCYLNIYEHLLFIVNNKGAFQIVIFVHVFVVLF